MITISVQVSRFKKIESVRLFSLDSGECSRENFNEIKRYGKLSWIVFFPPSSVP